MSMLMSGIYLNLALSLEPKLSEEIWNNVSELKRQDDYQDFLNRKRQLGGNYGFKPLWMPDFLFGFQQYLVDWSLNKGKSAIWSDCGTGKGPMSLVWGENVIRRTNKPVLVVTPIAVGQQLAEEAQKFGVQAEVSRDGNPRNNITITNYERLHLFNPHDYTGVVCDESSAIKNFKGKHKAIVTEFLRRMPYRLLCTATAAPNDYPELGTSSEALGELGYMDMLNRYFKNDNNNSAGGRMYGKAAKWRFKGHAEEPFWRWLSSWARAMRKPSDFGFEDNGFILPPLIEEEHIVKARTLKPGFLFEMPAEGLNEEREEEKRTLQERCEKAAELASTGKPVVIWCNLNPEGKLLAKMLPDLPEISGSTKEDEKETLLTAFRRGQIRGLIIKPKIGAWGLNLQNCCHTIVFPTHSYEQLYQLKCRFYRFGQKNSVKVDYVTTEGGQDILRNLKRKAAQADRMFNALVRHMNEALKVERRNTSINVEVPAWL